MCGLPGQLLCILFLIRVFLVEVALEIEGCTVREVAPFFRYDNIFVFELFKYCFRDRIGFAGYLRWTLPSQVCSSPLNSYWHLSNTCCSVNNKKTCCSGLGLWYRRNDFRRDWGTECCQSGDVSDGWAWRRYQDYSLPHDPLHSIRVSVLLRNCIWILTSNSFSISSRSVIFTPWNSLPQIPVSRHFS